MPESVGESFTTHQVELLAHKSLDRARFAFDRQTQVSANGTRKVLRNLCKCLLQSVGLGRQLTKTAHRVPAFLHNLSHQVQYIDVLRFGGLGIRKLGVSHRQLERDAEQSLQD